MTPNPSPLVSVVMAAKNYARFVPLAIGSVVRQTVTDWELIIVDDGSTDDTASAVQPYLADRRVRYVRSDLLGQSRAKNLGARLSRGAFIAYLDADDAWLPMKLEKQLDVLHAHPACGVCFCLRSLFDENDNPLTANAQQTVTAPPRGRVLPQIFLRNFVCFSSVVIRRQVFDHLGGFDPQWDLAIDYDLWLRVARHYEFECVDEPLVLYRTGHGNLSKRLTDRVLTADSIMTQAVFRRGLQDELSRELIGEGYASTYRSLGYTLRKTEPGTAAKWYWRALLWPGHRGEALKGLVASLIELTTGPYRSQATGENAAVNR